MWDDQICYDCGGKVTGFGTLKICISCEERKTQDSLWQYQVGDQVKAYLYNVNGAIICCFQGIITDRIVNCQERHLFFCEENQRLQSELSDQHKRIVEQWEKNGCRLSWNGAEDGPGYMIKNDKMTQKYSWNVFLIAEPHIIEVL